MQNSSEEKLNKGTWDIEKTLKLAQILALLVAGAWAVYEYFDYKKESNRLGVIAAGFDARGKEQDVALKSVQLRYADEQQKNAQKQQELQVEIDKITIKDKENDVALKGVELQYADQQHRILQEQQALAVGISKLTISKETTEGKLRDIDLQAATTDNIAMGISVSDVRKIRSEESGNNLYEMQLVLQMVNKSKVEKEITFVVIEYFMYSLEQVRNDKSGSRVTRVGSPPNIFNPTSGTGWTKIGYEAHVLGNSWEYVRDNPFLRGLKPVSGGAGVGAWSSGDGPNFGYKYLVKGKPNDFVGFTVSVCVERCRPERAALDESYLSYTITLPQDTVSTSPDNK